MYMYTLIYNYKYTVSSYVHNYSLCIYNCKLMYTYNTSLLSIYQPEDGHKSRNM